MAFFSELDDIINNVIGTKILTNQNICKLLYYYPEENTPSYNPLIQPDIDNPRDLLMTHIYPVPKRPDASIAKEGYLTVTLNGATDPSYNQGFTRIQLVFDIIFHLDTWAIKGSYRPYKIANEIDMMFNNQLTDLRIENKPVMSGFRLMDYSTYFYGIQLVYGLVLNNNIGCNTLPIGMTK